MTYERIGEAVTNTETMLPKGQCTFFLYKEALLVWPKSGLDWKHAVIVAERKQQGKNKHISIRVRILVW